MVQASTPADGWFEQDWQAKPGRRLGRATAWSLALHVGVCALLLVVRLPQDGERPLASIEVNLASLPTPAPEPTKAVEQPKQQQKAVEVPKPVPAKPAPAPVKSTPVPAPAPTPAPAPIPAPAPMQRAAPAPVPVPVPPAKSSNDVLRDIMKGVELPPDAPKFGDFSPTEKAKKAQLKLPDVPVASEAKQATAAAAAPDVKPRASLADDLTKELDEEFQKIRRPELPKAAAPVQTEPAKPAPPQVEAKIPSVKTVDTTLKVPGMAPGSNAYLARVRQRISSFWTAPPVDATGQTYLVIVKFRLHRNGSVTGVTIEQSSGNEYYDLAGKRAVLTAIPLPAFPAELTDGYFDAHFTFMVGEQQG